MASVRSSGAAVLRAPRVRPRALSADAVGVWGTLAAAVAYLLVRVVIKLREEPLFEDEAVAGLVSARPLREVVEVVLWERGGGPVHFVLSHVALRLEPSAYGMRWLSVAFALAAVPLCYDLGRRLAGPLAGVCAAMVAATSPFLEVYGSFARMYALYVFASALALDLFVRAVERRTGRAAFAAALAAWLLPAVHPYGAILVAAEALVALALWRGRPLRPALPVLAVGAALLPFAWADLRLASRFGVGVGGEEEIAGPADAWSQLARAFGASAGGEGLALGVVLVLVLGGVLVLVRRHPAFVAVSLLALVAPPTLLMLVRAGSQPGLSPRHFIYALPITGALVGAAVAWAVRDRGRVLRAGAVVVLGAFLLAAPFGGIRDPRDWQNDVLAGGPPEVALGTEERLAAPSAWLEQTVREGDVIYPYSSVYLGALSATGEAHTIPYSQRALVLRALERIDPPVRRLVVSVPLGQASLDLDALRRRLGGRFEPHPFGAWLLIEGRGPFSDDRTVLLGIYHSLLAARDSVSGASDELERYFKITLSTLCGSVHERWGDRCPLRFPAAEAGSARRD